MTKGKKCVRMAYAFDCYHGCYLCNEVLTAKFSFFLLRPIFNLWNLSASRSMSQIS